MLLLYIPPVKQSKGVVVMMGFKRKTFGLILSVGILFGVCFEVTPAHAYVEDAGVLDNFHTDPLQPMWDYLNSHNYRFYNKKLGFDYYITKDNTMFMAISNGNSVLGADPGVLYYLIFINPGPKTDLGIQVGDSVKKLIETYGEARPTSDENFINNQPRMGYYMTCVSHKVQTRRGWERYYQITYFDRKHHHIDFMIGQNSNRIMAIQYRTSYLPKVMGDTYEADQFVYHVNNNGLGYYF